MCVTSLLCGPRANQYGRFMDCNVNFFLSIHKEHHWYSSYTLFFCIRMLFFPAQAEYSYFSADFILKL